VSNEGFTIANVVARPGDMQKSPATKSSTQTGYEDEARQQAGRKVS